MPASKDAGIFVCAALLDNAARLTR